MNDLVAVEGGQDQDAGGVRLFSNQLNGLGAALHRYEQVEVGLCLFLPWRKWDGDHDPEGLLSTLLVIGTCLLGVLAGLYVKTTNRRGRR